MIERDAITREVAVTAAVAGVALLLILVCIVAAAAAGSRVAPVQSSLDEHSASLSHAASQSVEPMAVRVRNAVLVARAVGNLPDSPASQPAPDAQDANQPQDVGANAVSLEELQAADKDETEGDEASQLAPLGSTDAANALLALPAQPSSIMGRTLTSVDAMVAEFEASGQPYPLVYAAYGAPTVRDWCQQCYEEAVAEGVRAEVLFAQSMHETGWLQFGGQVVPEQCNFGGLGATNDGAAGGSFPDVRTGLRAQVQHLKAYATTQPLNNDLVDERFDLVSRGSAPTVQDLGGKWAVPGYTYGDAIMGIVERLV